MEVYDDYAKGVHDVFLLVILLSIQCRYDVDVRGRVFTSTVLGFGSNGAGPHNVSEHRESGILYVSLCARLSYQMIENICDFS